MDKNGKVVERYPPTTSPLQIEVRSSNINVQKVKNYEMIKIVQLKNTI